MRYSPRMIWAAVLGVAMTLLAAPASAATSMSIQLGVGSAAPTAWLPDTYWVTSGTPVAAVVTGENVTFELQQKSLLGLWLPVTRKTLRTKQTVRLSIPLDQRVTRPVRTQSFRIVVWVGLGRQAYSQSFRVIGPPAAPPPSTLRGRAVGVHGTRWDRINPCTTITWAMDVRRSPYGSATTSQMVTSVIDTLRARTGLKFAFRGYVNHSGDPNVRSPYTLTIVWAKIPSAGEARSDLRLMRGSRFFGLGKGTAVIYPATMSYAKQRLIVLHEVMHLLGAGHSRSGLDVMYPSAIGQQPFGAGDLAVFKQIGAGNTCF